ncbi:probable inactive receptor kinase At2g26730 [Syzygium oleosum]|uniref:probable inactive receptor kinase At2g26730 n=1 Tax=Syzygium oleosum TaxID=219896 RepID=UPI0011D28EDC|nr:probable inactive receptor kinase At2g26730 [Syzygium oleosum]
MAIPMMLLCSMSLVLLSGFAGSEPTRDRQALLAFVGQIRQRGRVRWNDSASACDWVGVKCDPGRSSVRYLRLPGVGLVGDIPPGTIGRLSELRVLSLRYNGLSGRVPSDFSNLTKLRGLYLQHNAFTGEFPPELTRLTRLVRLDISSNGFSGQISFAIDNLASLTGLFLENNNFSGELPSISASGLRSFNVSNNRLNGSIPASLSKFPVSAFAGNLALCGRPLEPCTPSPSPSPAATPPSPRKQRNRLSRTAVIAIAVGSSLFVLLLLLLLCLLCCRRRRRQPAKPPKPPAATAVGRGSAAAEGVTSSSKEDNTSGSAEAAERKQLVFMGGPGAFDLEDLLRASAEVLGKGGGGTSYKAVLEEGTTVVVKRLKDVAAGKRVFEEHMEAVGKVRHDNVVELRAYYYSNNEKLLVFDYFPLGSLAALLHGSRGSGRPPLDWENRLRIAIHAAQGLAHLHSSSVKLVHGNIKSSNVLLRPDGTAAVSDFGLGPLLGPNASSSTRVVGYRAPEVNETRKATFKSDVYSFGVLLLELLTGKAPNQALLGEEGIDLPRWVQSVVTEEWTAEVFDVELTSGGYQEDEMVQVLQIAMSCVAIVPDQRPRMSEVVRMMEEMRTRSEAEEGTRPPSGDPSKGSDGHAPPIEMKTQPVGSTS